MKKLILLLLAVVSINSFAGVDVTTYIPKQAPAYLPVLKTEQVKYWADHPIPYVLAGLIEQESCISLTHSRCWNSKSELKTARERGVGLGQITVAYKADGSVRFDALQELKDKHPILGDMNWNTIAVRPDLQLAAIVLKSRDDFKKLSLIKDPIFRLHFTDVAYNSGMGNVNNKRRACGLSKSCDPQQWFGNVENIYDKNAKPIYGTRTAAMITKEHTEMVFHVRANKYKPFFQ